MSYYNDVTTADVREHGEGANVRLGERSDRLVIVAYNECGHNATFVDLLDILAWVKENRPELLNTTAVCDVEVDE